MIERLRKFLDTPRGRVVSLIGVVLAVVLAGYVVYINLADDPLVADSKTRTMIDSTTNKSYKLTLEDGMKIPFPAPSGKNTGYPAEFCSWTKDGQIRSDPFPVLTNQNLGKPGPTFCPDCGRLVVPRNPVYKPGTTGVKPPPTQAEFKGGSGAGD